MFNVILNMSVAPNVSILRQEYWMEANARQSETTLLNTSSSCVTSVKPHPEMMKEDEGIHSVLKLIYYLKIVVPIRGQKLPRSWTLIRIRNRDFH